MASQKISAATVWKVIVGTLAGLLILLLVAEFGTRWYITKEMKEKYTETAEAEGAALESDPEVSFGPTPVTFDLVRGKLSEVELSIPSNLEVTEEEINGNPAADIRINGLTRGDNPVADKLSVTTTIPDDALLVLFQDQISEQSGIGLLRDTLITNLTAQGGEGVIEIEFAGGMGNLSLRPEAKDGRIEVSTAGSSIFGIDLPKEAGGSIGDALTQSLAEQFAGELTFDDVAVNDGELVVSFSGENVELKQLGDRFSATKDAADGAARAKKG